MTVFTGISTVQAGNTNAPGATASGSGATASAPDANVERISQAMVIVRKIKLGGDVEFDRYEDVFGCFVFVDINHIDTRKIVGALGTDEVHCFAGVKVGEARGDLVVGVDVLVVGENTSNVGAGKCCGSDFRWGFDPS